VALHACTSQINFKSCPVQCGSSVLRLTNGQYGGDMLELRPVVTPQEIIARIKESGTVPTPSTSSTTSLTQATEVVEPEDTVSNPAVLLTSCERAKVVVERDLLTLDPKLAVFTVIGTREPRLVKLFPQLSARARPLRCAITSWRQRWLLAWQYLTLIWERSTLWNCIATNGNEPTRLPAGSSRDCEMSISEFRGFLDEKQLNKT